MTKNKIKLFFIVGILFILLIYFSFFSTGPCVGVGASSMPTILCFIGSTLQYGLVLSPVVIIGGLSIWIIYNYIGLKRNKKSKGSNVK